MFQRAAHLRGLSESQGTSRCSAELKTTSEVQIHAGIEEQACAEIPFWMQALATNAAKIIVRNELKVEEQFSICASWMRNQIEILFAI